MRVQTVRHDNSIDRIDRIDPYHSHRLFSVLHQNQHPGFAALAGGSIGATNGAFQAQLDNSFDSLLNFDTNEYVYGSSSFSALQYSHSVSGEHSTRRAGIASRSVLFDMTGIIHKCKLQSSR